MSLLSSSMPVIPDSVASQSKMTVPNRSRADIRLKDLEAFGQGQVEAYPPRTASGTGYAVAAAAVRDVAHHSARKPAESASLWNAGRRQAILWVEPTVPGRPALTIVMMLRSSASVLLL